MQDHMFASFPDAQLAERAVGALMDHGVDAADISFVASQGPPADHDVEGVAKTGITTTTGADAASGATAGGVLGAALGALGAIASLFIPGFGFVVGGGALATAILAAMGTTAGGAVVGSVYGYLRDLGVPEQAATDYEDAIREGGAMISVRVSGETLAPEAIREILDKYQARNVGAYGPSGAAPARAEAGTALTSAEGTALTAGAPLGGASAQPTLSDASETADRGDRWRAADADAMTAVDTDLGSRVEEAHVGPEGEATQPLAHDVGLEASPSVAEQAQPMARGFGQPPLPAETDLDPERRRP